MARVKWPCLGDFFRPNQKSIFAACFLSCRSRSARGTYFCLPKCFVPQSREFCRQEWHLGNEWTVAIVESVGVGESYARVEYFGPDSTSFDVRVDGCDRCCDGN